MSHFEGKPFGATFFVSETFQPASKHGMLRRAFALLLFMSAIAVLLFTRLGNQEVGAEIDEPKAVVLGQGVDTEQSLGNKPKSTPKAAVASTAFVAPKATYKQCKPAQMPKSLADVPISPATNGVVYQAEPIYYYVVNGSTANDVKSQLKRCSPVKQSGITYAANVQYRLSWKFSYANSSVKDGCKVTNAVVGLRTRLILPSWSGGNTAFSPVWDTYSSSLLAHEQGHINLYRQRADTMLSAMKNFPATPCSKIADKVNQIMKSHIQLLGGNNASYDASTNHGATQGAVL